jgi:hypothetical protein
LTPQPLEAPFFQLLQRSSSLTPARALSTCRPHPTHDALPQSLQAFF